MSDAIWLGVISRISMSEPVDLDQLMYGDTAKSVPSLTISTYNNTVPSARLWGRNEFGQSYIGVRVSKRPADCKLAALRLAAAALERRVVPIIFTTLSNSGFERFGFRVERIVGDTPKERLMLEQELRQFWDIAIEFDISDVAALG